MRVLHMMRTRRLLILFLVLRSLLVRWEWVKVIRDPEIRALWDENPEMGYKTLLCIYSQSYIAVIMNESLHHTK